MTTRKTIALTRQSFVGKVMSLLFNMLSTLVIAFLPRSKCLLVSWQIDGGNNGNSERLYFGGTPKSLQMVTAAMILKDACSLEEKL